MATEDGADARVRQLGEYIRLQRQMADLSLRGMADLTKVSNAYLSQIERGLHQPSLRVLQASPRRSTFLRTRCWQRRASGPRRIPRGRGSERRRPSVAIPP